MGINKAERQEPGCAGRRRILEPEVVECVINGRIVDLMIGRRWSYIEPAIIHIERVRINVVGKAIAHVPWRGNGITQGVASRALVVQSIWRRVFMRVWGSGGICG